MKYFIFLFFSCISLSLSAQYVPNLQQQLWRSPLATTFVTDYQAIQVNPANLGFSTNPKFSLGLFETGFTLHSNATAQFSLGSFINGNTSLDLDLFNDFLSEGMAINVESSPIAFGFRNEAIGGFAGNVRTRAYTWFQVSDYAADIIVGEEDASNLSTTLFIEDQNDGTVTLNQNMVDSLLDDNRISFRTEVDANIAFGRRWVNTEKVDFYAGAGIRYIHGLSNFDFQIKDGILTEFSSVKIADILDNDISNYDPQNIYKDFFSGGKGYAFDLGATVNYDKKYTFSMSALNLGAINWEGSKIEIDLNNASFNADSVDLSNLSSNSDIGEILETLEDEGFLTYENDAKFKEVLPAEFRMGFAYKPIKILQVGIDTKFDLNQNARQLSNPLYSVGVELQPIKRLRIGTGFVFGNGQQFNLPLSIVAGHTFQFGIHTKDLLSFVVPSYTTSSFTAGFIRIRLFTKDSDEEK